MGREIKRVPIDFDWLLNVVWKGYVNPYHSQQCTRCNGDGYSPQARLLHEQWYGDAPFQPADTGSEPLTPNTPAVQAFAQRNVESDIVFYLRFHGSTDAAVTHEARRLAELFNRQWSHHLDQADVDALVDANRLWDFTRVPLNEEQRDAVAEKVRNGGNSWLPLSNGYRPTAAEVNEWSLCGMSHDSINASICIRAKCARLGTPVECDFCNGSGEIWFSERVKQLAEGWYENERYGPPEGDGWQVWETVSEGSPISPVFATFDELVAWLVSEGYSEEAARKFIEVQWVPSMAMLSSSDGTVIKSDIETLTF